MKKLILAALMIVPSGLTLVAQVGERVFRPERYSRGDLGVRRCQPIDDAAWVWHPGFAAESCAQTERYLRLRRAFTSPGASVAGRTVAQSRTGHTRPTTLRYRRATM